MLPAFQRAAPSWQVSVPPHSQGLARLELPTTPGEWGKDRQDVAGLEGTLGRRVGSVDECHSLEIGGNAKLLKHVVNGAIGGDFEPDGPVATGWGQERRQGCEESDLDPHRKPPCPSDREVRVSATRSRSPGRIRACSSRRFQRRTSATETPYIRAIEPTVSLG
jgi:hypothetical protein